MKEECKYCSSWDDYRGECAGTVMFCITREQIETEQTEREIRDAAEIVRDELMRKGDWYNALVNSIYGYLRDTDGSKPWGQMARDLADRIIGADCTATRT